jgi:hypothetical protein
MTQAAKTIEPALNEFYGSLAGEQKSRFDTLGQWGQKMSEAGWGRKMSEAGRRSLTTRPRVILSRRIRSLSGRVQHPC